MKPTTDPTGTLSAIDAVIRDHEIANVLTHPEFVTWENDRVAENSYGVFDDAGLLRMSYLPGTSGQFGVSQVRSMVEFLPTDPPTGCEMTIGEADYIRGLDPSGPVPLYTEGAPMWLECTVPECPVDEDDDDAHWVAIQAYTFCRDHAEELPTSVRDPDRERRDRETAHEPLITRAEVHQERSAS